MLQNKSNSNEFMNGLCLQHERTRESGKNQ